MGENPFLRYLRSHPKADEGALKELFRILAKRTHPDAGGNSVQFVQLQEAYHKALTLLIEERAEEESKSVRPTSGLSPREQTLQALYRYLACIPKREIDTKPIHERCRSLFALGVTAAKEYDPQAAHALVAFGAQFHDRRSETARYPDVRTKYCSLLDALHAFFDATQFGNALRTRVARSYLAEIHPVVDYDPAADPHLRTNRSAQARAALYAMRQWIERELDKPPARLL